MKNLLNIPSHYRVVRDLYFKYERLLLPATMVVGFLVDYFTFINIKISTTFAFLLVYWVLAGIVIAFIHEYDAQKFPWFSVQTRYLRLFSPLFIQFTFGALLSSSLVFYWFSGAFSVSWPLMAAVVLLMIFNEAFRQYFQEPIVQISVYFFATISLLLLILPFLFNSLSVWMFILAGIISVIIFVPYVYFLSRAADHVGRQKHWIIISLLIILGLMNALYFTDIMPPIPLALREAGLYHSIKPTGATYAMQGEQVYLYTAVFAPTNLKTTIVHHWQYYDEPQKEWLERGKLEFNINGGRKEGYKGYSWQTDLQPGRWRVYVENQRGQVLGRIKFNVERAIDTVELQEIIR